MEISSPLKKVQWFPFFSSAYMYYTDVIMSAMASEITGVSVVYSTVCSGADQRKYQSSAPMTCVRGLHRWPVNLPHKGPVTRKCFHLMTSSCELQSVSRNYFASHYNAVIVSTMTSQITSAPSVCPIVCSVADQRKTSKLRVTGLCEGNSPMTGDFPAQRDRNAENVSIWWRHHDYMQPLTSESPKAMWRTCVSLKKVIISPGIGASSVRRQSLICNNTGLLLVVPLRISFSEIWIKNTTIFVQDDQFENGVFKITVIMSRSYCRVLSKIYCSTPKLPDSRN